MAAMTPWVRQYSLRDLLDDCFDLFKARLTTLVLAAVIPYLLVVLYVAIMRLWVMPGTFLLFSSELSGSVDKLLESPDQLLQRLAHNIPFVKFTIGLVLINGTATLVSYIAQCRIAVREALGLPVSLRDVYRWMAKPFWSLVVIGLLGYLALPVLGVIAYLVALVVGLLGAAVGLLGGGEMATAVGVTLGLVTLVIVGAGGTFILLTALLSAPMVLAFEHAGPFMAIGKSLRLAGSNFKAHFWAFYLLAHVNLTFSAVVVIIVSLLQLVTTYLSPIVTVVIGSVVMAIGNKALLGLMASFQTLVYLDGRCRKENFDLRLLARDIGLGEEVERAFDGTATPVAQAMYPDYTALPVAAAPAAMASAAVVGVTAPPVASGYPDYSAPPPSVEPVVAADAAPPVISAYPDYSAPPPSLEPPATADKEPGDDQP
ncbi:MAG TPA: hypothetical protein VGL77_10075 [Armatimonadota bacterium]